MSVRSRAGAASTSPRSSATARACARELHDGVGAVRGRQGRRLRPRRGAERPRGARRRRELAGGRERARGARAARGGPARRAGARDGRAQPGRARARRSRPTPTWSSGASATCEAVAAAGGGRVHVKLDSGHGTARHARPGRGLARGRRGARRRRGVELAGVMTHFATADELERRRLLRRASSSAFTRWARAVKAEQPELLVHAANSAAMLREPDAHFDMVRCGIASTAWTRSARIPPPARSSRRSS